MELADGTDSTRPVTADAGSVVDEITDRLVTAIALGEYLTGARLPAERELALTLGVARTTVRIALARLVELGFLETRRGRSGGSFVRTGWTEASRGAVQRTLSERIETIRDSVDAMSLLHGTIARAAAERRSDDDVRILHACVEEFRHAASGLDSQRADLRLHLAIGRAARNETMITVLTTLESRVSISAPAHLWGGPAGMREMELRALAEHEELVAAIAAGDSEAAGRIATAHVGIDLELVESALARASTVPGAPDAATGR